jgi:ferredoxin
MTYSLPMGRKFPKITIDLTKCTVPFLCKQCLQACPMAVFNVTRVMAKEKRLEEMDPRIDGNYVLRAPRRDKCTVCNLCIDICPVDAITINVPKKKGQKVEYESVQINRQKKSGTVAHDYFAELKKQPYPLFTAPKPYSFDLNEDMVQMIRKDFNPDKVVNALSEVIKGKSKAEAQKTGETFFKDMGEKWMRRTIQMGDEYYDRTIEMIMETVDRQGKLFLIFPHVLQRYVEIAYLATQDFLKVPITLNNANELSYRIPKCALYRKIEEKVSGDYAKLMTCKDYCQSALAVAQKQINVDMLIDQPATTAKEGFCEFSMRKL